MRNCAQMRGVISLRALAGVAHWQAGGHDRTERSVDARRGASMPGFSEAEWEQVALDVLAEPLL